MESIVFFGKGGVGKSTIASNITAVLAYGGRKVLHVGCDPKMDSTLSLMGRHIPPFTDRSGSGNGEACLRESIYPSSIKGVHCIEAGGPQPGVGCAGLGIGSMLDAMKDGSVLEHDGYQAAVFDVLGDVVCGGFAAPLRRGFAKKVVIVTSETLLSLYAANRLIMMVNNYARNGVYLAGLVVNAISPDGVRVAGDFARAAGTKVLGVTLRDPAVAEAEREHRPAVLARPKSDFALRAVRLASAIRAAGRPAAPPRSMTDGEFFAFMEGRLPDPAPAASGRAGAAVRAARGLRPAASILESAGFRPSGIEGGQVVCDWNSSKGVFKTLIAPLAAARGGLTAFSDWALCFHPAAGRDSEALGPELRAASSLLAPLRFEEIISVLTGAAGLYAAAPAPAARGGAPAAPGRARQHLGFGQWPRFIFAGSEIDALAPPDSVMAMHGDSECRFCICEGGALGAFSENACLKPSGEDTAGPVLPRSDEREPTTDFRSAEAVFGDEEKMQSAMRTAAAQAGDRGLVEFYVGCSPLMLASDAAAFAARVERETGAKIWLDKYCSLGKYSDAKAALRAEFMAEKFVRARGKAVRDVNLIYYGSCPPALRETLSQRGITAEEPGEEFYTAARAARLQVLSGPDTVLSRAYDKAGLKWLLPPAPYGFAGTDAWVSAIAAALGRKTMKKGPSAPQAAAARGLRAAARGCMVGFVLPAEEISRLSGGAAFKTVPVLQVLAEAGFKLRFFVMAAGPAQEAAALSALRAVLPARGAGVKFFREPRQLHALLRADREVRLVYSDIRGDRRLAAAGKNPFSAALFEPGYAGALETWRRLCELCDWDFNERYISAG